MIGCLWTVNLSCQDSASETDEIPKKEWTESDTRLANHYIKILQKEPSYGNVLNLLWDLYEKKGQEELLMEYFAKNSEGEKAIPKILFAHLLRKSDELERARVVYSEALDLAPENRHALQALAELNDREKRYSKALSLYTRLAAVVPFEEEDGIPMRLRKAELHRLQGQTEKAVETWKTLLQTFPDRNDLRSRIVGLLLEVGETDAARSVLEELAKSEQSRERVDALLELTRLNELISDFEGATESARAGLKILHFRSNDYADLFSRLVQVHERFDKLSLLEEELVEAAAEENPTERSLHDLAEFFRLTADPVEEERALHRLLDRIPSQLEYRLRLTRVLMRNDRYEEAARVLEVAFEGQERIPLHLLLLRSQISLSNENRKEAEEVIEDYLKSNAVSEEENREIIEFARENYLDRLVETLLSRQLEESALVVDTTVPMELARFLHERGRKEKARETLESHVAAAEGAPKEKARRLQQVATVFRDLEELDRALLSIEEALELDPGNSTYLTTRADLLIDADQVEAAIDQLEEIWNVKETYVERADIDQRLFSLMRGHYSSEPELEEDLNILKGGSIQSLAQYRRLAAAASRLSRPGDEKPPEELIAFYAKIKETANQAPSAPLRYRAAWWALKLQDNQECYEQLVKATEEEGKAMIPHEEMLLELAVLNERPTLMVKHLTTLAEIDPDNADDYLHRKAEMRFELGFEDEAIRELKALAAKPGASLNTLATLAKVYQRQGSPGKQIEVWQRAYRDANIFEKRRIVKQLATALLENNQPEEALEVQLDLIERESDELQKRKQLDTQLTVARSHYLLGWLLRRYTDITQQKPFDPFFAEALARIHLASENEPKAFEQLKKAYYMSGQREDLLDELGRLANTLGDLDSAIYYRRQLLARDDGSQLEHWEALVEMLEKDLRVEEADRLRLRLESKFGREPEFLEELAETYLKNGDPASAERALKKLLSLREWDLPARFRLALVLQSRQKREEALGHYEKLLSDTRDLTYSEADEERALPLIQLSSNPEAETLPAGSELHPFIFSIEELPFLGGNVQDEIAEGLEDPRPEFSYFPKEESMIRLRALEEASCLVREMGKAEEWSRPFLHPSRPLLERLWVARYTGNRAALVRLIEERPWEETHLDRFLYCYLQALCGRQSNLADWARPEAQRDEGKQPRANYAAVSAFLLLKDQASDPLLDREWLFGFFEELSLAPKLEEHFFSELRKKARYEDALRLGRGFAKAELGQQGGFLFALSQVAGWAGSLDEREEYLENALSYLQPGSRNRSDGYFMTALTERLSLLPDDLERKRFLAELAEAGAKRDFESASTRLERQILLAIAGKEESKAIQLLGQLVEREMGVIRPRSPDADQVRYEQIQSWQRMAQLFRYYVSRIPTSDAAAERALFEALGGDLTVVPRDESVLAEYEQYEIDRRVLQLESLAGPERSREVAALRSFLKEPDSHLELARTLESVGLHGEAIPVFRAEAMNRGRDYSPLQGLFEACNVALNPGPALEVIDQINAREFPAPPGLTSEYLAEQKARFLLHSRNLDRLIPLGQRPKPGDGRPPIASFEYIPYRAALIEVYRVQGNTEALLILLRENRDWEKIEKKHLLLGARTLAKEGKNEEALKWIDEILKDPAEPMIEREALVLASAIHEKQGWPSSEAMVSLAKKSLESHPLNLTRQLAGEAYRAGSEEEANSLLKLLRRNTARRNQRSAISGQLMILGASEQLDWTSFQAQWEGFFRDFVYEVASPTEVLESARAGVPATNAGRFVAEILPSLAMGTGVEKVLRETPAPVSSDWLRRLLLGHVQGNLRPAALSLYSDAMDRSRREEILETLPAFGTVGIEIAHELLRSKSIRGTELFLNQPYRQVLFYHAIGDRIRLVEVHQSLMREAQSDLFHQTGLDLWFPTLTSRYRFPTLLAVLGEEDLALRLFRRYEEGIDRYRWNHTEFLKSYLEFLIDQDELEDASRVAKRLYSKTLQVDLRLLVRLLEKEEDAGRSLSSPVLSQLSQGQLALIKDWRSALAESREMVEYSDTW